ncbi:hypothetical protein [uncultured Kriegella sp.]|uniref:hypothetical protein n=1 Tax=uncultured Kriegella sp. TaxID=1798910 RepID=UPI0030D7B310|tara:strand:+ start:117950 stop:118288 length:339 start_codon:yes stop_codon:yes gene_type:complete
MELIYKNEYGACFRIYNAPNPICTIQLVVDTIGIFMSEADLEHLLTMVRESDTPCQCRDCGGEKCNKIWCATPLVDICLKVNDKILEQMEDLIMGTRFLLEIDSTLEQHKIK